jgi:HK97 family phage major capsid protein
VEYNPFSLTPEHEESVKILDAFTRQRFHDLEQREEWRRRAGLNDDKYNLTRLLSAMGENAVEKSAPYEWAVSQRIAEQVGRRPRPGYCFLPVGRRDATVAGSMGALIQTDVGPQNTFPDFLHEASILERLGVPTITLDGPATIPFISSTIAKTWLLNENSAISEGQITTAISASTPKTVGVYQEISRHVLRLTTRLAYEYILRALANAIAAEVGAKALTGASPNGELAGVYTYGSIGSVSAASANLTTTLAVVEKTETANGLVRPSAAAFVMAPLVAKLYRGREKAAGSGMLMEANNLIGYPALVTPGASPNSVLFGDWSRLLLLEYGILEIMVDPYGASATLFKSGMIGVRALWSVDTVLLSPGSFAKCEGLT